VICFIFGGMVAYVVKVTGWVKHDWLFSNSHLNVTLFFNFHVSGVFNGNIIDVI